MTEICYVLTGFTMAVCALLLLRHYAYTRNRLLLWSGLCFAGLGISNVLEYVDIVMVPDYDLYPLRLIVAAIALTLLMFGLIWDVK